MSADRPAAYDATDLDEMTLGVLAELAEVRERLAGLAGYLDPYNDLRDVAVGRAEVLAVLDAMAAEIVANNTDEDGEPPPVLPPMCPCPPRQCLGAPADGRRVRCAAVCQILPGL